jgi:phosphatidylserine/phosphatidylglycerophosphate/cardiolipin synthase-like enzyme
MKKLISSIVMRGASKTWEVSRKALQSNPFEVKGTGAGAAVGLGAGYAVGGAIGVVGFFGGIGIPWLVIGAIGGAIVGNRIGIAGDKHKLNELLIRRDNLLRSLLDQQDGSKIKPISTPDEHRAILLEALEKATDTLVILSGWATSYVVNKDFQKRLGACLQRGVNVYIGYGYTAAHEPRPKKSYEKEADDNLQALKEWCALQETKGILVARYYPNHAKLLICDEKFAVNGSFNWLSNSGRSLNEERSWVVFDRDFVSTELDIVIDGLMSPLKSTKRDFMKKFIPWSTR